MDDKIEDFIAEFYAAIPRYLSQPDADISYMATDPATKKITPLHRAFPEQFEAWKQCSSLFKRRSIILSALDTVMGDKLATWQKIERYVCDSQAQAAFAIASNEATDEDLESPDYWAAFAKVNFVLTQYYDAETYALKALTIQPQHTRAKILLADILRYTDRTEQAMKIYKRVLGISPQAPISGHLRAMVNFESGPLHSPVFAAMCLVQNEENTNATAESKSENWKWAFQEFSYSPQFRCEYAMTLIDQKKYDGLVHLVALTREAPWYKDVVVYCYQLIRKLKLEETWKEDFLRLEVIMEDNCWSGGN